MDGHSHRHLHKRLGANFAKRQNSIVTEGGTVYSVVYVTAEPTFTGVIGGYTTLTSEAAATTNSFPAALTQAASDSVEQSTAPTETVVAQTSSASSARETQSQQSTATLTSPISSNTNTSANTAIAGASSTADASTSSSSTSDGGLPTGAKAGIAIGVIVIVGIFAVFLLWLLGKKKKQRKALANNENEKSTYGAGAAASTPPTEMVDRSPTSADAPRLSLRPVSRMLPEFMGSGAKGRMSNANTLNTIGESATGPARNMSPSPQPRGQTPQPASENPFADPQNPFSDPEKPALVPAPLSIAPASKAPSDAPATVVVATTTPTEHPVQGSAPVTAPAPQNAPAPAPVPTPTASAAPSPTPVSMPSTPVTPAPIVATGPGPETPQGNVYRIMMDFKPSMEDELELIAGQLVRLLHEYDDGWALCIRLDRSQQGVVPRTCLAAKPSKPKPSHLNQYAHSPQAMRPPPGAAGSRPMSPAGNYGPPRPGPTARRSSQAMIGAGRPGQRPMSPAGRPNSRPMSPAGRPGQRPMSPAGRPGQRPMSPAGRSMSPGPFNQAPRPLSPGPRAQQQRSMSPGPYGGRGGPAPMGGNQTRRRSNSASALSVRERRNTPPGPSNLRQGSIAQAPGIAL